VVGVDDLDRLARGLAAEILDCHARRFDRAFARGRRQDAGLIGQHAQLDDAARNFRLRRLRRFLLRSRWLNQRDGEEGESEPCEHAARHLFTPCAACCARAPSGQVAEALPRSVMNSRRLTGFLPLWRGPYRSTS